MSQNTETGSAKIVANFEELLSRITTLGSVYQPASDSLKLPALQAALNSARDSISALNTANAVYAKAVDARQAAFEGLSKLSTRVINMLKASVDDKAQAETAAALVKKLRGDGKKASATDLLKATEQAPKTISTAQSSYDMKLEHFSKLIEVLLQSDSYAPQEAELKTDALLELKADLKTKTNTVIMAKAASDTARANRDQLIFSDTGLVPMALNVKTYLRAALTSSSPQYKPIMALPFK